jgi:ABC-2 type transport system permease protein
VRVRKVWAVIRREFVERVRTKWFWVSAVLGPVLFAGIIVFQIVQSVGGAVRYIAVVDSTTSNLGTRVVEGLGASKLIRATRVAAGPGVIDSLTRLVETKQLNGFLILTNELAETGKAEYRASNLSLQTIEELQRALNRLIVKVRLEQRGVNPAVVDWAQSVRVTLDQKKIARGRTTTESAGESFVVAYVMAILLFMAILLYGVNVMSSVLEEKTTRIIEVLVSSLRPFQLMAGKVLGAGAVSFFQFVIWGVSARVLISLRGPIARALGADAAGAGGMKLPHVPFATLAVFMAFFVGGFLLYSAMFAAVGAMSSNEQEARQAQQPVTVLLMISYLSIIGLTNDPSSTFAKTLSIVPFTSPIATPVRWTAGSMGTGELIASLAMLAIAIVGVTWVASRIYRVGILMTGKRPTMKELIRWVRTA